MTIELDVNELKVLLHDYRVKQVQLQAQKNSDAAMDVTIYDDRIDELSQLMNVSHST